ncbi:MAG: archease [Candidatus Aenigmarchaeota archaeon]|nr:archease [Candidatus Aenigmarchaeota archaeon]NIP39926.1 archease [Candidatus Aenigmarchaeota archaeon]NIQ17645.1 archease [Candidatus Aenigmarchaeota archaeon]NIS72833.1 archease [Candidatus Aenigmarchaeota archaeon]
MKYKFIDDLTSDVLFEAYGKDLKDLFTNAALALFSVICQIGKVKPRIKKEVEVGGEDTKDLMFNWLQELIVLVDTEEMFFSKFEVREIDERHLKAKCYGEGITKGKSGTLVKGVTYHKFGVEKTDKGYKVTVSLDI